MKFISILGDLSPDARTKSLWNILLFGGEQGPGFSHGVESRGQGSVMRPWYPCLGSWHWGWSQKLPFQWAFRAAASTFFLSYFPGHSYHCFSMNSDFNEKLWSWKIWARLVISTAKYLLILSASPDIHLIRNIRLIRISALSTIIQTNSAAVLYHDHNWVNWDKVLRMPGLSDGKPDGKVLVYLNHRSN